MRKSRKPRLLIIIAIVICSVYAAINLISLQSQIREQNQIRGKLEAELKAVQNGNAALQAAIESEPDDEAIAKTAYDKLGLVMPGERIIIDVSN